MRAADDRDAHRGWRSGARGAARSRRAAGTHLDRGRYGGGGGRGARRRRAPGRAGRPAAARGQRPARQLERTARGLPDPHRADGGAARGHRGRGLRLAAAGHAGAAGSGTAAGRLRGDLRHRRRPGHRSGRRAGRLRGAGLAPVSGLRRTHVLHPGDRAAGVPGACRAGRAGARHRARRAVRRHGLHRGRRRGPARVRAPARPGRASRRG